MMLDWFDNINTTIIPVEFKDGKFVLKDGMNLPKIQEGARAEIIIPSFYIEDQKIKKEYNKEVIYPFFKEKTIFFVELYVRNFDDITDEEKNALIFYQNRYLVEIELINDLNIKDRGTKYPRLEICSNQALKIKDLTAKSLNEMYSKLSQKYEKHRMSHTGNVFDKVYYLENKKYRKLKEKGYGE